MKYNNISILKTGYYIIIMMLIISCQGPNEDLHQEVVDVHEESVVHLSQEQFKALSIKVDSMAKRNINAYVETNGQLTLPPQSEATVTTIIGANINEIKIIEGDRVSRGQTLAYISHPDLINIQAEFVRKHSDLEYLEKEFERQQKLYDEKVNSGREYQKIKSEYLALKAETKGMRSTLKLLSLNPQSIIDGEIYEKLAVKSPINGYIRSVNVRMGQFVQSQHELFEIVNNDHIHAHFLVYENDIQKVKKGQKVHFQVASMEDREYEAIIFSVGKVFEAEPKAVEIHAEIENTEGNLISGMYCRGKIITENIYKSVLPKDAVVRDGDKKYIFTASPNGLEWEFMPIEIISGIESDNWVEIKTIEKIDSNTKFAHNQAYYLLSEWKKEDSGHDH